VGEAASWLGATETGVVKTKPIVARLAKAFEVIRTLEASGPRYAESIHKKDNAPIEVTRESSRGRGLSINMDTDVVSPSE
jgi:hypothetical protein